MKAIVTGAAGFVGSHLSARLLRDGCEVIGVDSFTDYYDAGLKRANIAKMSGSARFRLVEADLNTLHLETLLSGADLVFHQAGQPGVRNSWGSEFKTYTDANVLATQRLLEAARGARDLKRFVYASSSSVYGDAERFPVLESDLPAPLSPYGVTKLAAEHLCSLYARNFGVPTTSLRYFTVYGPRQRPDMAFTRFVEAFVSGGEIEIYGDGNQVRDFTYIDDVVEANVLASRDAGDPGSVFNVAGGSNVSVNDVLDILRGFTDTRPRVGYKAKATGDVRRTGGSTDRIADVLGWKPSVNVEDGLRSHFAWGESVFATSWGECES